LEVGGTVRVMAHLLGYARVSTTELSAAGCWRVWTDHASGALDRRPELDAVLEQLWPGDTLVVRRLDRLGRSLWHLIEVVTGLDARGREIIRDRTVAGLTAPRVRGTSVADRKSFSPVRPAGCTTHVS